MGGSGKKDMQNILNYIIELLRINASRLSHNADELRNIKNTGKPQELINRQIIIVSNTNYVVKLNNYLLEIFKELIKLNNNETAGHCITEIFKKSSGKLNILNQIIFYDKQFMDNLLNRCKKIEMYDMCNEIREIIVQISN